MAVEEGVDAEQALTKRRRNSRLWLTLLEDLGRTEWPPSVKRQGWRVVLSEADTLHACGHRGLYRTSPVFPLTADFNMPDLSSGSYYLCFYVFDPAFPVLGRLSQKASPEMKAGLLYTIGLASILLITNRRALADKVEQIAETSARSKETWHIDRGRIKSISCKCSTPANADVDMPTLSPYGSLPLDARTTVDEFVATMAILLPKVQMTIPNEMSTYIRLVALVNELLSEMLYACNPNGSPPVTLAEYGESQFGAGSSLGARILYQNIDRLVQINSALSYVSTQALSGAVPILDRRSLIRRYSLLGIGTSVLALTRISHSIESAFAKGAVEHLLTNLGGDLAALPGLDNLPHYDSRHWHQFSINSYQGKVQPQASYPKLPYFSGRLGFRETEYTISAAMQTLAAGGSAEWSLLTVTHELVHGHVRNVLSAIFQGDPDGRPDQKWGRFYDRFEARCKHTPPIKESLLDSLRAVILTYCCNSVHHGSLTRDVQQHTNGEDKGEFRIKFELPSPESLLLVYSAEYRNISEVLVHVLDLHYFYRSCLSHYIPLIWRSWSKAPQVRGDLRQYLLRSLLVIAAKTEGSVYERFQSACTRLSELLESVQELEGTRIPVIDEAAARLNRTYREKHLLFPFIVSLMLVDLAHHVLTSSTILGAINAGDPHFRVAEVPPSNEEWLEYDMPPGFVEDVVVSPTAYIAHRLTQPVDRADGRDIEAETAVLFIACSSHQIEGAPDA
jgi:hypothetical protein